MSHNRINIMNKLTLFVVLISLHSSVFALSFTPTAPEWGTWGEMCQARYVVSGAGVNSIFANKVAKSTVKRWKRKMQAAWYGLHHYCAGLILVNQGKPSHAIKEFDFTLARVPTDHYLHAEIMTRIAMAYFELGQKEEANTFFDTAISQHNQLPQGYIGKAITLRKDKQLTKAIEILVKGDKNTEHMSAEINYHLGLAYYDNKQYERSKQHANIAYELGYPLQGLRRKLNQINK